MKLIPIGIILFFSLRTNILFGQYIPIVEEGKFWIYLNHWDEDHPAAISGHAITFLGDTVINSLSYKKVYKHALAGGHPCQFPPCFQFDIPYHTTSNGLISFIREDTANKKVFNLPVLSWDSFCDTSEYLIFDYSLNVGDTLNSCIYEFIGADFMYNPEFGLVDSIKLTERFGKNRNTIFTTGYPKYGGLGWSGEILILEGVGLEHYGIFHEPLSYLVDFCEDGMEACDLIASTPTVEPNNEIAIFPNPTNGMVQISIGNVVLKRVGIYSTMGVFITEFINTAAIDISNLKDGVYILELIKENNERIARRIVKYN